MKQKQVRLAACKWGKANMSSLRNCVPRQSCKRAIIFGPEGNAFCISVMDDGTTLMCLLVQSTDAGEYVIHFRRISIASMRRIYASSEPICIIRSAPGKNATSSASIIGPRRTTNRIRVKRLKITATNLQRELSEESGLLDMYHVKLRCLQWQVQANTHPAFFS